MRSDEGGRKEIEGLGSGLGNCARCRKVLPTRRRGRGQVEAGEAEGEVARVSRLEVRAECWDRMDPTRNK